MVISFFITHPSISYGWRRGEGFGNSDEIGFFCLPYNQPVVEVPKSNVQNKITLFLLPVNLADKSFDLH